MRRTMRGAALILVGVIAHTSVHAGVFDLPSFLEAGKWSVGFEPEIIISTPTGAGVNLKPRWGATDFLNWQGIIGTGTGHSKFRIGTVADFEWFPDIEDQPGIATPLTLEYRRVEDDGLLSWGFTPLLYKSFKGEGGDYTPFVGLPYSWGLRNSKVASQFQVAIGSMFKPPGAESYKFTLEAGFNVRNSFSYISGGFTYYQ